MAFRYAHNADGIEAGKVEIVGHIVRATAKAILFDDGTAQNWLPLSKIHTEALADGLTRALLPEWLAKQKGLI